MKTARIFLWGWLLCGAPSLLWAAESRHEFIFEPGAGIQLKDPVVEGLDKNVDSFGDASAFFGAQYLWDPSQNLGIGLDINFLGDSSARRRLISGAPTAWQTKSLVVIAVLRYYVAATPFGKPYLLVGLGGHRTTLLVDDNLTPIIDSSRWGLASALGAGWDIPLRDPFLLGVESRWQFLSQTHYSLLSNSAGTTTATGGRAQPSSFDLLLRMGIRI